MKHGARSTVNALKEKGNRGMAFLYQARANSFKGGMKKDMLDGKADKLNKKADYQREVKNSSRAEVKRLKEQRLARKKAEFQAKNEHRMNQVDSGKNPKNDTPKTKRIKGGKSSPKKQPQHP